MHAIESLVSALILCIVTEFVSLTCVCPKHSSGCEQHFCSDCRSMRECHFCGEEMCNECAMNSCNGEGCEKWACSACVDDNDRAVRYCWDCNENLCYDCRLQRCRQAGARIAMGGRDCSECMKTIAPILLREHEAFSRYVPSHVLENIEF